MPTGERFYRRLAKSFVCGVTVRNGRVDANGTAPILRRLAGLTEQALLERARDRGWTVSRVEMPR